jgi:uncharacterized protein (TIGR04255 family)
VPLFEIPEPPSYTLTSAPLAQALAQIRFPLIADFETMAGIAPLQNELRDALPYMEQEKVQELSFVVGPAGPAAGGAAESITWKLTNDQGYLATIGAGSASLSIGTDYTNVGDFAGALRRVLDALAVVHVPRCDRLGVRYLSLAEDLPGDQGAWRRWFRPEILGWVGSEVPAAGSLANSMAQVQLSQPAVGDLKGPPGDVQAVVRHGVVPRGTLVPGVPPITVEATSYLLDLDVFAVGHQRFDSEAVLEQFALFHAQIDRFFYWSLTEEGGEHFGLEVRRS